MKKVILDSAGLRQSPYHQLAKDSTELSRQAKSTFFSGVWSITEAIAKLVRPVKSSFWRQFPSRFLACPFGHGLVCATRASLLALKNGVKIIDFLRHSSFATASALFLFCYMTSLQGGSLSDAIRAKATLFKGVEFIVNDPNLIFPGLVSVTDGGRLIHASSNNYSPDSFLYVVNSSYVDFGSSHHILLNLMVYKGVVHGASATITLLSPKPAIIIKDDSVIAIKNLILSEGGYMQFSSLSGIFDGSLCQDGFMTMDLGGKELCLDAHQLDIAAPFSVGFNNVNITHGSISKSGPGGVFFTGQGSIPSLTIQQGSVYIGKVPGDSISSSGDLEVEANGTLGGFGTLDGNAVHNSGVLRPGNEGSVGALQIAGGYFQSPTGTLLIKAQNAGAADLLTVVGHEASLDGSLFLQVQTADALKPGDQIVVLSNPSQTISGTFASFDSNLPSHLQALVQYETNQVKVRIISR